MLCPTKPKRPAILTGMTKDLTLEQITELPAAKAEYDAALARWAKDVADYHEVEAKKVTDLRTQCERDFNMIGHPKAALLWECAWDEGHSSGLQEVYNAYDRLVELAR